jgi:hypothetical protein
MRKWFASLGVLGFVAAAATAQTIPTGVANALRFYQYDDGRAETSYKIAWPSGANEAFSVDFDDDARGKLLMGVQIPTYLSSSGAPGIGSISVCPDNLTLDPYGHTPDPSSPLTSLANPTGQPAFGGGFCVGSGGTCYDTPDVTAPTTGIHALMSFVSGDSGTWLCTDADGGTRGHSFYTTNSFASTAIPFSVNWMLRLATPHYVPNGGEFLINGGTNVTVGGLSTMSLQFWSRDSAAPTFYLQVLDVGILIPLPGIVLLTGLSNFAPNGIQSLGELSGIVPCSAAGAVVTFRAFFEDNLDLKPNGHKKIKLTAGATATLTSSKACCPQLCFGIADDGAMDGTIWKVQGTAGSKDYFSVHMGFLPAAGTNPGCPPNVNNLTGVESVSWDFCGSGPCWGDVMICQSNIPQDPSGNTPDVGAPLTSVGGASACMPPGSIGWGFPAVFYDTPDIAANTTTDYHTAMRWASGDSCTWMGADEDTVDDDAGNNCAPPFPNTTSFFTLDGYATNAIPFSFANWQERIDWN